MRRWILTFVFLFHIVLNVHLTEAATWGPGYQVQLSNPEQTISLTLGSENDFLLSVSKDVGNGEFQMKIPVGDIHSLLFYPVKYEDKKLLLTVIRTDARKALLGYLSEEAVWDVALQNGTSSKIALKDIVSVQFVTSKTDNTDAEDYAKTYVQKTLRKGDWIEFQVLEGNKTFKETYAFQGVKDEKLSWLVRTPNEEGKEWVEVQKEYFSDETKLEVQGVENVKLENVWVDDVDEVKNFEIDAVRTYNKETKEVGYLQHGLLPWTYFKGLLKEEDSKKNIKREVVAVSRLLLPQKEEDKLDPEKRKEYSQTLKDQLASLLKDVKDNYHFNADDMDKIFDLTHLTLKMNGERLVKEVPTLEELKKNIEERVKQHYESIPQRLAALEKQENKVKNQQKELRPKIVQSELGLSKDELQTIKDEVDLQKKLRDKKYDALRQQYVKDCEVARATNKPELCKILPETRMTTWTQTQKDHYALNKQDLFYTGRIEEIGTQKNRVQKLATTPQEEFVQKKLDTVKHVALAKPLKKDLARQLKEHSNEVAKLPGALLNQATFTYPKKDYAVAHFPGTSTKIKFRKQTDGTWKIATLEVGNAS